jgi:CheY-like chemotaxis protein
MKKSILLIDDDEIILMLLKKTLKDNGYKVYTAISGEKGIEKLKKCNNVDLIITDYDIPGGISGIEIL